MIAAIYARKSTEQAVADEAKSVTRQADHAHEYAKRKGWTVTGQHAYVDDGVSGAEFLKRPGFLRLMNALKPRPPFQVLIMSEESRLGRESIETAYALKQLITAGVRVFFYLEDRERTLDSPTDKIMMSLTAFADEMERARASQRVADAMERKARAGHVTGGRVFGYDNVEIVGPDGRRSHVERRINETEAAIVRQVFRLSAEGHGMKAITKRLNAEGAPSPRAQQGRSHTWAPSSVREVLHRDLYRGLITWNRTRKRNQWGAQHQVARPPADWIDVPAPQLAIASEREWLAAHARLEAASAIYRKGTQGRAFGRPALGSPSKYLLTNLALCGCCGGTLHVRSWSHGNGRKYFYACSGYHLRGKTVCGNNADAPMVDTDEILIEALLDDVLDPTLLHDAVEEALSIMQGDTPADRGTEIEADLQRVEHERQRLMKAIAAGRTVTGLLEALQALDTRKATLETERVAVGSQRRLRPSDAARVRHELLVLAGSWRRVLADDRVNARPIVTSLLNGRVTITPGAERKQWELRGEGTLSGLFSRSVFQSVWRPHRDSNPGFSLERAAS